MRRKQIIFSWTVGILGHTSGNIPAQHKQAPVCTCDLVANQLAGLNLADATKQAAKLLLGHVLGQVVDNEVGLAVVICWASLHGRGAAAAVGGRPVGCGASSAGAICHWSLHVTDNLEQSKGREVREEEERGRGQGRNRREKKRQGGRERDTAFISKGFCAVFSNMEHWTCSTACRVAIFKTNFLKSVTLVALSQINSLGEKGF